MDIDLLDIEDVNIECLARFYQGPPENQLDWLRAQLKLEAENTIDPPNRPHDNARRKPRTEVSNISKDLLKVRDNLKTHVDPKNEEEIRKLHSKVLFLIGRLKRMTYSPCVREVVTKLLLEAENLVTLIGKVQDSTDGENPNTQDVQNCNVTLLDDDFAKEDEPTDDHERVVEDQSTRNTNTTVIPATSGPNPVGNIHNPSSLRPMEQQFNANLSSNFEYGISQPSYPHRNTVTFQIPHYSRSNFTPYHPNDSLYYPPTPAPNRSVNHSLLHLPSPYQSSPRVPPGTIDAISQNINTETVEGFRIPEPVMPYRSDQSNNQGLHQGPPIQIEPHTIPGNPGISNPTRDRQNVMNSTIFDDFTGIERENPPSNFNRSNVHREGRPTFAKRTAHLNLYFDGSRNGLDFERFLFRFERLARNLGIHDVYFVDELHFFLKGQAAEYYWSLIERFRGSISWSQLRSELIERYRDRRTDFDIRRTMDCRKQKKSEPFLEFYSSVIDMSLPLQIPLSQYDLLMLLHRNMSLELQDKIAGESFRSVEALVNRCVSIEDTWTRLGQVSSNRRKADEIQFAPYNETQLTSQVEALQLANKSRFGRSQNNFDICYNCRQPGHRYQDCNLEVRNIFCYGCGEANVVKPNCRKCNPKPEQGLVANVSNSTLRQSKAVDCASNTDPELLRRSKNE